MYTMIPFSRRNLIDRANALFDDRFVRSFFNMNDLLGGAGFRVDIRDREDSYVLEAELPGVSRDRIDLSVENDMLTVSADYENEHTDEKTCYSERRTGHVSRSFSLEGIRQEDISAEYREGVLYVTLPKEQPAGKAGKRQILIGGDPARETPAVGAWRTDLSPRRTDNTAAAPFRYIPPHSGRPKKAAFFASPSSP